MLKQAEINLTVPAMLVGDIGDSPTEIQIIDAGKTPGRVHLEVEGKHLMVDLETLTRTVDSLNAFQPKAVDDVS